MHPSMFYTRSFIQLVLARPCFVFNASVSLECALSPLCVLVVQAAELDFAKELSSHTMQLQKRYDRPLANVNANAEKLSGVSPHVQLHFTSTYCISDKASSKPTSTRRDRTVSAELVFRSESERAALTSSGKSVLFQYDKRSSSYTLLNESAQDVRVRVRGLDFAARRFGKEVIENVEAKLCRPMMVNVKAGETLAYKSVVLRALGLHGLPERSVAKTSKGKVVQLRRRVKIAVPWVKVKPPKAEEEEKGAPAAKKAKTGGKAKAPSKKAAASSASSTTVSIKLGDSFRVCNYATGGLQASCSPCSYVPLKVDIDNHVGAGYLAADAALLDHRAGRLTGVEVPLAELLQRAGLARAQHGRFHPGGIYNKKVDGLGQEVPRGRKSMQPALVTYRKLPDRKIIAGDGVSEALRAAFEEAFVEHRRTGKAVIALDPGERTFQCGYLVTKNGVYEVVIGQGFSKRLHDIALKVDLLQGEEAVQRNLLNVAKQSGNAAEVKRCEEAILMLQERARRLRSRRKMLQHKVRTRATASPAPLRKRMQASRAGRFSQSTTPVLWVGKRSCTFMPRASSPRRPTSSSSRSSTSNGFCSFVTGAGSARLRSGA